MSTRALLRAVEAGRLPQVTALLGEMTDAECRACLPALRELRKKLRPEPWHPRALRSYPALHAAGAVCHTGAAASATWLTGADMRSRQAPTRALLDVLSRRPPTWLGELAHRLAARPPSTQVDYGLMAGLIRMAAGEPPTTRAFVTGWVQHMSSLWQHQDTLADRLRQDPHTPRLVAALFVTADIGASLAWCPAEGPNSWAGSIARLTEEGVLNRPAMLDGCVARLLRGGSVVDQRAFLRLLRTLAPTRSEERERLTGWAALAADGVSTAAGYAQSVLARLALDGELTVGRLAEVSEAVLFRPEKKLVRAQLVLLGKVLRREPTHAPTLLPVVAGVFGHEDTAVQERALKLVTRHLDTAGDARGEIASAVEQLSPGLRSGAAATLGVAVEPAPLGAYADVLPPPPEPRRLAPTPESEAQVVEDVSVLLASPEEDMAAFETVLDGLVRRARADREGLVDALAPVVARRWWRTVDPRHVAPDTRFRALSGGIDVVLATLFGAVRTQTLHEALQPHTTDHLCEHGALAGVVDARLWEVAYRIRTEPLPFLLATPTWESGRLDAGELVTRLAAYHRLGVRPGPCDFAQALLRADRTDAAGARAAAAALGTAEGDRLAAWLALDEPAPPPAVRYTEEGWTLLEPPVLPADLTGFPRPFQPLAQPVSSRARCTHWDPSPAPHWLAVVPGHRELVAARLLSHVTHTVRHAGAVPGYLPRLAEAEGPAGDAVHLSLAYGLCARHAEYRLAAVDALLMLAAREQLDARLLGSSLGSLLDRGVLLPGRLTDSARTAAGTGAWALLWSVLREALAPLLAGRAAPGASPVAGLGALLAVAAECAERSGARGGIPEIAEVAARRGSSQLVTQARRLQNALTGRTA